MECRLEEHFSVAAVPRALLTAGSKMLARMPIIPMTTSNSTSVNALPRIRRIWTPSQEFSQLREINNTDLLPTVAGISRRRSRSLGTTDGAGYRLEVL